MLTHCVFPSEAEKGAQGKGDGKDGGKGKVTKGQARAVEIHLRCPACNLFFIYLRVIGII